MIHLNLKDPFESQPPTPIPAEFRQAQLELAAHELHLTQQALKLAQARCSDSRKGPKKNGWKTPWQSRIWTLVMIPSDMIHIFHHI